jgi:hypothetical protein
MGYNDIGVSIQARRVLQSVSICVEKALNRLPRFILFAATNETFAIQTPAAKRLIPTRVRFNIAHSGLRREGRATAFSRRAAIPGRSSSSSQEHCLGIECSPEAVAPVDSKLNRYSPDHNEKSGSVAVAVLRYTMLLVTR